MSMCRGLPLTRAYVDAIRNSISTQGIPMSIMQQMGRLCVDSLTTGRNLLNEVYICGLEHLESNNTDCSVQGIDKHRIWHSGTDTPFTRAVSFICQVLLADGASTCHRVKAYERARCRKPPAWQFNSVLDFWDKCHLVHLCSGEQVKALAPQAALPQAKAKSKAKGKAKAKAKAATAHRGRTPRTLDFIGSMVRGAHLMSNARTWSTLRQGIPAFVEAKLRVIERAADVEEQAHAATNQRMLEECVVRSVPQKSRPPLAGAVQELVTLIGAGPWSAESCMRYYCSDSELLMGEVGLLQLREARVSRIAELIDSVLFRARPMCPAAGRWTGVPQASMWHAAVELFFNILHWLLTEHLQWHARVTLALEDDMDAATALGGADANRKFLGARRSLYLKFLQGDCALYSLTVVFCNAPVRELLTFLFMNSFETRGGLASRDEVTLST